MSLPRVVLVGFNKCATRSIAHLFEAAGHKTLHNKLRAPFRKSRNAARLMEENLAAGRKIFAGFEEYRVYSDLVHVTENHCFEGCRAFREILRDYPDTRLILNLRKREDWIASRLKHGHGEFADRYARAVGLAGHEEVAAAWRGMWDAHLKDLRSFIAGPHPPLVEFDIDTDGPEKLVAAFPEFGLRAEDYGDIGRTRGRRRSRAALMAAGLWSRIKPRAS